jgi:hypothetical protein
MTNEDSFLYAIFESSELFYQNLHAGVTINEEERATAVTQSRYVRRISGDKSIFDHSNCRNSSSLGKPVPCFDNTRVRRKIKYRLAPL